MTRLSTCPNNSDTDLLEPQCHKVTKTRLQQYGHINVSVLIDKLVTNLLVGQVVKTQLVYKLVTTCVV